MNRKNVPEYELTELPNQSATARLLHAEPARLKRAPPLNKPNSRYRDFLKHVGFQLPDTLVGRAGAWRSSKEHPKVATYQSRRMAALNSLLHLIPLSGAIILLVLFWTSLWVGGPSDNATTLQFVAKLHELLMQASLVDILLYIIRIQTINGYIPFGALSGAAKAPQLSYLWSLDFISAISSPAFSMQRKAIFALSASGLLFMTAVVGPSSAVLMIPRPDISHINGTVTRYVNVSDATLFPIQINVNTPGINLTRQDEAYQSRVSDFTHTPDGWRIDKLAWESKDDNHEAFEFLRTAYQIILPSNVTDYAITIIPTILSARQLKENSPPFKPNTQRYDSLVVARAKSVNARWTLQTSQPVVLARCASPSGDTKKLYYFQDDDGEVLLPNATELYEPLLKNYHKYTGNDSWKTDVFPYAWISSPGDSKSLLALYVWLYSKPEFSVCTISSFWQEMLTTLTPVGAEAMIQMNMPESKEAILNGNMREIEFDPEFVSSLSLPCQFEWLSSGSLASCFAAALSWVPAYYDGPGRTFGNFDWDIARGFNLSEIGNSTRSTVFEIVETIDGYGYGATDTSIRLSVAVIIAYCIIALTYISYTIATGHTSIAWDSPTELITLALQSKEPSHLGHISVGLDSMETFRKGVGIRVSTVDDDETGQPREKLELVFEDDADTKNRRLTKVVRGTAY